MPVLSDTLDHKGDILARDELTAPKVENKFKRTSGMWLFDTAVYPFFNNISVFVLSAYITYKGNFSEGENFLKRRNTNLREGIEKNFGFSKDASKNLGMVFWSFFDGCLIAPVVAMIEYFRNPIARKIDDKIGTTPEDKSVYEREAPQTWKTILGGRAVAAAIVAPIAIALNKESGKDTRDSWNHLLLSNQGARAGNRFSKTDLGVSIGKRFHNLDFAGLGETLAFEAFWTTVCTGALYASSHYLFVPRPGDIKTTTMLTPANDDKAKSFVQMPPANENAVAKPALPTGRVSTIDAAHSALGASELKETATNRAERLLQARSEARSDNLVPSF